MNLTSRTSRSLLRERRRALEAGGYFVIEVGGADLSACRRRDVPALHGHADQARLRQTTSEPGHVSNHYRVEDGLIERFLARRDVWPAELDLMARLGHAGCASAGRRKSKPHGGEHAARLRREKTASPEEPRRSYEVEGRLFAVYLPRDRGSPNMVPIDDVRSRRSHTPRRPATQHRRARAPVAPASDARADY